MKRIVLLATGLAVGLSWVLLAPPHPASAHPLGNFSVNQLEALDLYPDRVEVTAEVDIAELPTLQERSTMENDPGGRVACASLARDFDVSVAKHRLVWTVDGNAFEYVSGAAGLSTSRLHCRLVAGAPLGSATTVAIVNRYRADRVGWRELTALGHGVRLVESPLRAQSVSGGLRAYPEDLLSSPLDVRSARLRVEPGSTVESSGAAVPAGRSGTTQWTVAAEQRLRGIVGGQHLTPLVGVLAVLLALVLGAAHAALPGHGKTVMAACLAGRRGRPRDALAVGATVTMTHTGGVLLLGLLLTTVAGLVGETVLGWLGVVSGALVAIVGTGMLIGLRRRGRHSHGDHHHHGNHDHDHRHERPSRLSIIGIGIAGGLVPSPSALVILLGAIGLGRTGFGIMLVLGYGVGMAATLTAAGLLLIRLRERWDRRRRTSRLARRLSTAAPTATATLVLFVGLGLAGRALAALA